MTSNSTIIPSVGSPGYREPTPAEADNAIEQARGEWERMARDAQAAGREIPVQEIPRELAPESFRASADATAGLMRAANRRSFIVGIDLRALEAARAVREAAVIAASMLSEGEHTSGKGVQGRGRQPGRTGRRHSAGVVRRDPFLPSGGQTDD